LLLVFFVLAVVSALAPWSPAAAVSALFFLLLFFEVVLAVLDVLVAPLSAVILDLDFLVVEVLEDAAWSVDAAASVLAFLVVFFLVVVSLLWSLVLAWGLAKAGDTVNANNRHSPMIHVAVRVSLFMRLSSWMRASGNGPTVGTTGPVDERRSRPVQKPGCASMPSRRPRPAIMPVLGSGVNPESLMGSPHEDAKNESPRQWRGPSVERSGFRRRCRVA
jgi:hypothetical protein